MIPVARSRSPLAPVLALAIALVLAFPAATPARADALSEQFQKVRGSVVIIAIAEKDVAPGSGGKLVDVAGLGSGVLIDATGLVLTAAHVVQTAEEIRVVFADGKDYGAKVIASAPSADVALVRLDAVPVGATAAKLGDSSKAQVGDEIFVVGAPLGMSYTLTVGHISAKRQTKDMLLGVLPVELLQTDAVINHGNSGGPMFNMAGEVVGIVSYMISKTGGYEGLGFAISSNTAKELVVERRTPWSGLEGYAVTEDLAQALNVPRPVGILVQRVAANSPAAQLGLRGGTLLAKIGDEELLLGGDVVLEVLGVPLGSEADIAKIHSMLTNLAPGQVVTVKVLRAGKIEELKGTYQP